MAESFDFQTFVEAIRKLGAELQAQAAHEEFERVAGMVVREPSWKFRQQVYLKRLERLGKFLRGEDVSAELTPSETEAYALLRPAAASAPPQSGTPVTPAAGSRVPPPASVSAARPGPAPAAHAKAAPAGAERRSSTRIKMRTRVRIRRVSDDSVEVLEPANVSKGGLSFRTARDYAMKEALLVNMHYQPGQPESNGMDRRGVIVRKTPADVPGQFLYGLEFES